MTDISDLPPEDQQAIGKTLLTLLASFAEPRRGGVARSENMSR